jgi:hypothetical protein
MNRISRNISIILRAERMIARRHMAVLRNQTGILVFAALVGAIGLVMLNIAAFYWLNTSWSPSAAALMVALVNLVLAGGLVTIASRQSPETGLGEITELRDLAIEDLENEVQEFVSEVRDVAGNVRRIASDPLGTALPTLALPLITTLLQSLRKKDQNDAI